MKKIRRKYNIDYFFLIRDYERRIVTTLLIIVSAFLTIQLGLYSVAQFITFPSTILCIILGVLVWLISQKLSDNDDRLQKYIKRLLLVLAYIGILVGITTLVGIGLIHLRADKMLNTQESLPFFVSLAVALFVYCLRLYHEYDIYLRMKRASFRALLYELDNNVKQLVSLQKESQFAIRKQTHQSQDFDVVSHEFKNIIHNPYQYELARNLLQNMNIRTESDEIIHRGIGKYVHLTEIIKHNSEVENRNNSTNRNNNSHNMRIVNIKKTLDGICEVLVAIKLDREIQLNFTPPEKGEKDYERWENLHALYNKTYPQS